LLKGIPEPDLQSLIFYSNPTYSIAITYGKPWESMYDYAGAWTLESGNADIEHRLMIMKFCDKMISGLYRNSVDLGEGTVGDDISSTWNQLSSDLDKLESFARNFSCKL